MLCFMTLEGSPRYRGGSCAICTGLASVYYTGILVSQFGIPPTTTTQCMYSMLAHAYS